MLFLKRSNDVFMAARGEVVRSKVDAGMSQADAEADYGENPDYYDEFFVPSVARWPHIQDRLNDASVPFGSVLDQALVGLSQANSTLEHVLDHIHFMRVQGNKRVVSDDACKDLVRHFSRYRLRSEDFQFSDLLGSAYEFLINMFAESAGKKGGDFYTPRDVIRLMVRILNPTPGLSIYDPTCGSGGMLIISREYIEQSGGDATNLRLCGQVNDASAWSLCKINMLLHGIRMAPTSSSKIRCSILCTGRPASLSVSIGPSPIRRSAKTTAETIWSIPSGSTGAGLRPAARRATWRSPSTCLRRARIAAWSARLPSINPRVIVDRPQAGSLASRRRSSHGARAVADRRVTGGIGRRGVDQMAPRFLRRNIPARPMRTCGKALRGPLALNK